MRLALFLIALFFVAFASASCEENGIDINSASLEELDSLAGIGPAKAQAIIEARPFDSIEDLIDVKGIGEVTLNNIKTQGLACVGSKEKGEDREEINAENKTEEAKDRVTIERASDFEIIETAEVEAIDLNPKAIKTDSAKESLNKNFAISGFAIFCVLLAVLFIIKRKNYKNEFR